jgi:hypothetical protein
VAQGVLDLLPVTDNVYHHLAFTRPLVDAIVAEIRQVEPTGRVLVIGPNELLPRVLIGLGYEVDLWVLEGLPLSEDVRRLASRCGSLDEILESPAIRRADVIVVPYVAEAAELEPSQLLMRLSAHLNRGGRIVMASRQPGELRRRLQWLRRAKLPMASGDPYPLSPTWPILPPRRLLTAADLARAGDAQFRVARSRLVVDHRACITIEALGLPKWLLKECLYLAKVAVPGFRDCTLVTLVPIERHT